VVVAHRWRTSLGLPESVLTVLGWSDPSLDDRAEPADVDAAAPLLPVAAAAVELPTGCEATEEAAEEAGWDAVWEAGCDEVAGELGAVGDADGDAAVLDGAVVVGAADVGRDEEPVGDALLVAALGPPVVGDGACDVGPVDADGPREWRTFSTGWSEPPRPRTT
jgi:hypothetical protein